MAVIGFKDDALKFLLEFFRERNDTVMPISFCALLPRHADEWSISTFHNSDAFDEQGVIDGDIAKRF